MSGDGSIRHDFKNQLAIIRGFAEMLLQEAGTDDPRRSDFEEIRKAADAALGLLRQLRFQEEAPHRDHPDC